MKDSIKKKKLFFAIAAVMLLLFAVAVLYLLYQNGILYFTRPDPDTYKIAGLDVSRYQGEIDWAKVKEAGFRFAWIKATEGAGYADPMFLRNFEGAKKNGIIPGAYLFFRFDRSGREQAENFMRTVEASDVMLPPAVDMELMGNDAGYVKADVQKNLKECVALLKEHYGKTPVLYVTYDSYDVLIKSGFDDSPLWFRDILKEPAASEGQRIAFWQYRDNGTVPGISALVDLDVFCGTEEEFIINLR